MRTDWNYIFPCVWCQLPSPIFLYDVHTISNYILPSFSKGGLISIFYTKCVKSLIATIPLSMSYGVRIPLKNFKSKFRVFSLFDYSFYFGHVMKKSVDIWQIPLVCQKLGLFFKKIKIFNNFNSIVFLIFLWNFLHMFSLWKHAKNCKKIVIFLKR